jgi:hypothetical protein
MIAFLKKWVLNRKIKKISAYYSRPPFPNCCICEWCRTKGVAHAFAGNMHCGAQGYKLTTEVYNNELCVKLYEGNRKPKDCDQLERRK